MDQLRETLHHYIDEMEENQLRLTASFLKELFDFDHDLDD